MTTSVIIQFRVPFTTGKRLDQIALEQGIKRAEVARELIVAALETSAAANTVSPTHSSTNLDDMADRFGEVIAHAEAGREGSLAAHRAATAAYAAIRLGILMLLPDDRQAAFIEKLAKANQR